jgi:hypothetical protein
MTHLDSLDTAKVVHFFFALLLEHDGQAMTANNPGCVRCPNGAVSYFWTEVAHHAPSQSSGEGTVGMSRARQFSA